MTSTEFINIYWSQYISLEKEFTNALHYLSLDIKNEDAYSQAYAKLLLEIGSEVDVVFKEYCRSIDGTFKKTFKTIGRYRDSIKICNPDFLQQEVTVKNYDHVIQPWHDWVSQDSPFWWTAYNKVKHERTSIVEIDNVKQESFKFASQKYILLALAGLYQILVYYYYHIATLEGMRIVTPMPGSRLFQLTGGMWDSIDFYGDSAFYLEEGHLIWTTSVIHY